MNRLNNFSNGTICQYNDEPEISHTPAVLREFSSGWVIEYHIINPETFVLERKRQKFERMRKRYPSDKEARKAANDLCKKINKKLNSGWNPLVSLERVRMFTKLTNAMERYLAERSLDIREDSKRAYASQIRMLTAWIHKNKLTDMYVTGFTKFHADEYLTEKFVVQKISSTTYNNYLVFWKTAWEWFIRKGYCKENPFKDFNVKKRSEKIREIIPPEWDQKIIDYCIHNNPRLALVCQLVYGSFLRPLEICRLKVSDIHFDKSAIFVQPKAAKTGKARWAVLPEATIQMMFELNVDKLPGDLYLITDDLTPGRKPTQTRKVDKHWDKMRDSIRMPKEYQLYSYRDTGITFLRAQGVPDYIITNLTGHETLEMLTKYTHAPKQEALHAASQFLPGLGNRFTVDHSKKSVYYQATQENSNNNPYPRR